MRPADVAAIFAVAAIGAGLAIGDLSDRARVLAVLVGSAVLVITGDRRRLPLGLAGVFVVTILAPVDLVATLSLILGVALVGHATEILLPASTTTDVSSLRAMLDELDADVVDRRALTDLIDKEIERAQRLGHRVVVMALSLEPNARIASVLDSVRRVLRSYDLIGYEAATSKVFVVAVVPDETAERSVQAKVLGGWGVHQVDCRSFPTDAMTAADLLGVLEGRTRAVGREAA